MHRFTIIAAGLLAATSAAGQERHPTFSTVYNTVDRSSLQYTCTPTSNQSEISCAFVQVSVRKAARPDDLQKKIDAAVEEVRQGKQSFSAKECEGFDTVLSVLDGKTTGPDPEKAKAYLSKLAPKERVDSRRAMAALIKHCRQPSEASAKELVQIEHDKNMRTCKVNSHEFKQTLRQTSAKTWTVISQPSGDCGVVNLDRFEEASSLGNLKFWDYYSRKAVTNPNGLIFGTMKCSEMDQREYKYQWQSETYHVGCDYISFDM